jgi:hypothetical protein
VLLVSSLTRNILNYYINVLVVFAVPLLSLRQVSIYLLTPIILLVSNVYYRFIRLLSFRGLLTSLEAFYKRIYALSNIAIKDIGLLEGRPPISL